jgi:hypothetical protein
MNPLELHWFLQYNKTEKWGMRVEAGWNRIRIVFNNCSCEHSSEPSGFERDRHCIDRFSECELLKKKSFVELDEQLKNSKIKFCYIAADTLPY